MTMTTFRWHASALVLLLLAGSPAAAQEPSAPSSSSTSTGAAGTTAEPKTAKEFIGRATQRFSAGEYAAAIDDYRAAYQLRQLPTLIFNIAQAHRKASQWQEALANYERFIKEDSKSSLVPEAEAHAAAMRAKIEAEKSSLEREAAARLAQQRVEEAEALAKAREEERKKAEAALLLATTAKKEPIYKRPWFWIVIGGAAAAAIGVGIGVGLYLREPSSDLGVRPVEF